jgi:2',3'-cyclic-nucleotide 2'-phosphodiesterase (5'-nucleotidase family)
LKRTIAYAFLLALLLGCSNHYTKQKEDFSHFSLKDAKAQSRSDSLINGYRQLLSSEMSKTIAISLDVLTRDNSQSTLGNFVCDALKYAGEKEFSTSVNIVLVNRGGLRNNLPKGEITVGSVFELMPFENQMILLNIRGSKLIEGLKTIIAKRHSYVGLNLVVSRDSLVGATIGGKPISENEVYTLVTSDYLANGGDSFSFLAQPIASRLSDLKIRDAIIAYCLYLSKNNQFIKPYTDERLVETR